MSSKKSARLKKNKAVEVVFLNPQTCGISNNGGTRYTVNPETGQRSEEIDDELNAQVDALLRGKSVPGSARVPLKNALARGVLVPKYYDHRYDIPFGRFLKKNKLEAITIGELMKRGYLSVRGGHGSPSADQRIGTVPYIKVSDLRALRVNVNPTNLIPEELAKHFWRGKESGLQAWDIMCPSRASSNIGEFCILLPGEENVVLTKEVLIFRVEKKRDGWDPFYLLWALSLKPVRREWDRIILMQTNREDIGNRFLEIELPFPKSTKWATEVSAPFRKYFTSLAEAQMELGAELAQAREENDFEYIASITEMMNNG